RYNYGSVGLEVPLFNRAQRGRIEAAKVQTEMREATASYYEIRHRTELENQMKLYEDAVRQVYSYQGFLDATSNQILNTASKRLERGEISYLEWVILVNQSIDIKAQYLNAIQRQNEIAFRIEELLGR